MSHHGHHHKHDHEEGGRRRKTFVERIREIADDLRKMPQGTNAGFPYADLPYAPADIAMVLDALCLQAAHIDYEPKPVASSEYLRGLEEAFQIAQRWGANSATCESIAQRIRETKGQQAPQNAA